MYCTTKVLLLFFHEKNPIRNYNNRWIKGFFLLWKSDTFQLSLAGKKPYRVKVKSKAADGLFLDRQTGR